MPNVSLINGHIDNANRCIHCDEIIPEGRWHCPNCETPKKQTNFGRIKAMSVDELAEFLESTNNQTAIKVGDEYIVRHKKYLKIWLESEVDTE
jgi:hypothetical protein